MKKEREDIPYHLWQPVIGLEVHVQLNTRSKLFSSDPNRFGDDPNTNISVVSTGQPGALPVINKEAIKKSVQFGLAINAEISSFTTFDRKSYFYPDSPRNFQITQFENPIIRGGIILAEMNEEIKKFPVNKAHLEDDAGMLKHFSTFAGVDFNRQGIPLVEIVSEPCLHSPQEAVAYVMAIRALMHYLDASDCNMEEGSLRVDANVSVRQRDEKGLRPKTEIKNMNSFTSLELATEKEIQRQIHFYTQNPHQLITSGTYKWDADRRNLILMRQKESEEDYRYFPEPDLVPITFSRSYIETIKNELPELPLDRLKRYVKKLKLTKYAANILTSEKALADYFEEGLKTCPNAAGLCNWITIEFAGRVKDLGKTILSLGLPAENVAKLVNLIDEKIITGKIAKKIADIMVEYPKKEPETIIKENPDFQPLLDAKIIEEFVNQVIKENPNSVKDYQSGVTKAFGHLVGQVMKLCKGKAAPHLVNEILHKKLD